MIEPLEIVTWGPMPGKPGYSQEVGRKTIGEVGDLVEAELNRLGLLDESFGPFSEDRSKPFPRGRVACFAVTGGSEGHYVHVEVIDNEGQARLSHLVFLGKTFEGWDRAWKIAETCARLLDA